MITDEDIRKITEAFITIANQTGKFDELVAQCKDRSLGIRIIGTRLRTGFVVGDGQFRILGSIDKPTVLVTMDKDTFWDIINAESPGLSRAKIYLGVFTEESINFEPPPGTQGGALHMENLIKLFSLLSEAVIGG